MGNFGQGEILVMNTSLPFMSGLNVSALTRSFERTATSYKFAFFRALLNLCNERGFTRFDGKISCKELAIEMAAFAWYPYAFHKLSFGRQDLLGKTLDLLAFSSDGWGLNSAESKNRLRRALDDNYHTIGLDSSLRYVPHRLLTPFFERELSGKRDHEKNSMIRALADGAFCSDTPPLYRLVEKDTQLEMHPRWLAYLQESFCIVSGWLTHHWVDYLQSRNPNVPAISRKIQPPPSRQSLIVQVKRWRRLIATSAVRCIYSDEVLGPNSFELDHFVPWSFVCHDQPWNLMPVLPAANASKSNRLPSIHYMNKFIDSQANGLSQAESQFNAREWEVHTEPFLVDLRLTQEGLRSRIKLSEALKSTLLPMIALAKQSGFSPDWKYRNKLANPTI
jgi:hypothetical protein